MSARTKTKTEIRCLEALEIGDMAALMRRNGARDGALDAERRRLVWLREVRNDLAHNKIVEWSRLTAPIALQIEDFR